MKNKNEKLTFPASLLTPVGNFLKGNLKLLEKKKKGN